MKPKQLPRAVREIGDFNAVGSKTALPLRHKRRTQSTKFSCIREDINKESQPRRRKPKKPNQLPRVLREIGDFNAVGSKTALPLRHKRQTQSTTFFGIREDIDEESIRTQPQRHKPKKPNQLPRVLREIGDFNAVGSKTALPLRHKRKIQSTTFFGIREDCRLNPSNYSQYLESFNNDDRKLQKFMADKRKEGVKKLWDWEPCETEIVAGGECKKQIGSGESAKIQTGLTRDATETTTTAQNFDEKECKRQTRSGESAKSQTGLIRDATETTPTAQDFEKKSSHIDPKIVPVEVSDLDDDLSSVLSNPEMASTKIDIGSKPLKKRKIAQSNLHGDRNDICNPPAEASLWGRKIFDPDSPTPLDDEEIEQGFGLGCHKKTPVTSKSSFPLPSLRSIPQKPKPSTRDCHSNALPRRVSMATPCPPNVTPNRSSVRNEILSMNPEIISSKLGHQIPEKGYSSSDTLSLLMQNVHKRRQSLILQYETKVRVLQEGLKGTVPVDFTFDSPGTTVVVSDKDVITKHPKSMTPMLSYQVAPALIRKVSQTSVSSTPTTNNDV